MVVTPDAIVIGGTNQSGASLLETFINARKRTPPDTLFIQNDGEKNLHHCGT